MMNQVVLKVDKIISSVPYQIQKDRIVLAHLLLFSLLKFLHHQGDDLQDIRSLIGP